MTVTVQVLSLVLGGNFLLFVVWYFDADVRRLLVRPKCCLEDVLDVYRQRFTSRKPGIVRGRPMVLIVFTDFQIRKRAVLA